MKTPTISPQVLIAVLGSIVTQAVAFGILDAGVAQTIVAVGGIIIPAVFTLAAALHLGRVHAAIISNEKPPAVVQVEAKP